MNNNTDQNNSITKPSEPQLDPVCQHEDDYDDACDSEFEQITNAVYRDEQLIDCLNEMHKKGLTNVWMSQPDIQRRIPTAKPLLFSKLSSSAAFQFVSEQCKMILERQPHITKDLFRLTFLKLNPRAALKNTTWCYFKELPPDLHPTKRQELINIHLTEADHQKLVAKLAAKPLMDANNRTIAKPEGNLNCERIITYLNSHPPRPTNKPGISSQYINCLQPGNDPSLLVEMDQAGLTDRDLTLQQVTMLLNAYQEYRVPISRTEVDTIFASIFMIARRNLVTTNGYTLIRRKKKGASVYRLSRNFKLASASHP